jgi:periplasmic protein TonB
MISIFTLLLHLAVADSGQSEAQQPPDQPSTFVIIDRMPEPIGGWRRVQQALQYPEAARKARIEGEVLVQFIVNEQGDVVDPVVLKGIGNGCDEAAITAIQQVRFKPGMMQGKPVKVRLERIVTFKIPRYVK